MPEPSPTTVAILTPPGRGAVAVVAVDGPRAKDFVKLFFRPNSERSLSQRSPAEIVYGRWGGDSTNLPREDVIVQCRSQTSVEVHCHGGSAAAQRIVDDLTASGAMLRSWSDWVSANESNTIRAAARCALAQATTRRTASILLDQYRGALEAEVRRIVDLLNSHRPGPVPKGDEEGNAAAMLRQLLVRAPVGLHLTQPWRVVVAGPPNVGKSRLINALAGYQRSIVFDQPGTTRDVVTASAALGGWPVELADTAGWRESDEPLEAAGVAKARQQAAAADCLLLVFDASLPWSDEDDQLIATWPNAIVVVNKCDLSRVCPASGALFISALTGDGIAALIQTVCFRLVPLELQPGDAVPFTEGHVTALELVAESLQGGDFNAAREALLALLA